MIFYGFLALIVVIAIPYGSVQPWWTAAFECVVFGFGIVAVIDLWITGQRLPANAKAALPLLILVLFLVVQSLPLFAFASVVIPDLRQSISADPFTTQQLAIKLLALIVAGVLLLRYTNTDSRVRSLAYVIVGVAVASALLGLLRHGSGGPGWFFPLPKNNRGFAQFVNRNHFGFLIEMALGLAAGLAIRGSRGYQRWLLVLTSAFLWISLIVANSRGAIFASLCQLLFLVIIVDPFHVTFRTDLHQGGRSVGKAFAVQGVLVIALIAAFAYGIRWVGGEAAVTNLEFTASGFTEQGGHERRENVSRRDIWRATWNLIKAHPVAGSGFGAYWIAITKYHDASGTFTPQEAHNDYLEFLAAGGLIGVALCGWFALWFISRATKVFRRGNDWISGAALGALVGLFGVMVHNAVDFGLHITINAVVLMTLIAIVLLASERRRASTALEYGGDSAGIMRLQRRKSGMLCQL